MTDYTDDELLTRATALYFRQHGDDAHQPNAGLSRVVRDEAGHPTAVFLKNCNGTLEFYSFDWQTDRFSWIKDIEPIQTTTLAEQ